MNRKRTFQIVLAICFATATGIYLYASIARLYQDSQPYESMMAAAQQKGTAEYFLASPFQFDQSIPDEPTTQTPVAALATLQPQDIPDMTLAELNRQYPAFQHVSFDSSGFNPLQLPFRYEDVDNVGDPSEANALSFLMSHALDWAPGNYCARHAYFVFKRSRDKIRPLMQSYDSTVIADLVQSWKATHAVGGVLIRSKEGCSGRLEIYDSSGQQVFSRDYKKPRDYFDLLGDMAVDAITFFGPPPNQLLIQNLHLPRCLNSASIVRLGMAAFLPERGDEEFGLYSAILQADPDFAEVRYWWANQKYWTTLDNGEFERQLGLSLQSRPIISTLREFEPSLCRDQQFVDQFPERIATAEKLVGDESPVLLGKKLALMRGSAFRDSGLLDTALKVAGQYPNYLPLLVDLSNAYLLQTSRPLDAELVASISIAGLSDRYMPGIMDKRDSYFALSSSLISLGRNDVAASGLEDLGTPPTTTLLLLRVQALSNMGRFDDAARLFLRQPTVDRDNFGIETAMDAAISALACGDKTALQKICGDWETAFDEHGFTAALAAYNAAMTGQPVNFKEIFQKVAQQDRTPEVRPMLLLASQVDLILHRRDLEMMLWQFMSRSPGDRLYWVLFDAYQRRTPSVLTPGFYQSLAWLYPDDPWVKKAVADWRARKPVPWSQDQIHERDSLKNLDPLTPPWTIAQMIHESLDAGDVAGAHDMACSYQTLAAQAGGRDVSAWAARLVRLSSAHIKGS